jgi:imidazoleglycerol-phosphate dehydratase
MRNARATRKTRETEVTVELAVDGSGRNEVRTGVGFLDHMLTHVAVHGLFDLTVTAEGDTHVDAHHTVEDVALVLGQALDRALTDRAGIARIASEFVPMDEALARVAVDLSGRPYAVVDVNWTTPTVGGIPTSLVDHFFESFAVACRANVHAHVLFGRDAHHMAEALFKAFGRALSQAVSVDERRRGAIPSTKGTI